MHRPGMISIWFFIGVLLLIYGLLICGSGIYEAMAPPAPSNLHWNGVDSLHPALWWGGLLIIMGAIYIVKFAPRKGN